MRNAGLFRHAAKLVRRRAGSFTAGAGTPVIFEFEATNLEVELVSFGDTSPFHDLPDGATVYVEIGVDMDWAKSREPAVAHAVEEFERCGRRPKFGPIDASPGDAPRPGQPRELEVMMSLKTFEIGACACPACGMQLDATTAVPGQGKGEAPKPGDLSLCFGCGELLQFVKAVRESERPLELVRAAPQVWKQMEPAQVEAVMSMQMQIRRRSR